MCALTGKITAVADIAATHCVLVLIKCTGRWSQGLREHCRLHLVVFNKDSAMLEISRGFISATF